MTAKFTDDWGSALGSDKDTYVPPVSKKKPKKDSLSGLVYEFQNHMLVGAPIMSLNSQINGPAMMKVFRKLLDAGKTYEDIRAMMSQFAKDITIKPLTDGIPAWKAFAGRLDTLANKVGPQETPREYDGPKIDPRLMSNDD